MQFTVFSLFAFAAVAMAAPKPGCLDGGFFYSDRNTLEPCKSSCIGGTCSLVGTCAEIPGVPILCSSTCKC